MDLEKLFEPELMKLINNYSSIRIVKNSYVLIEGEYCPGVPLVIDGVLKIVKEEEDSQREHVLYRIRKGESCIMSITSSMLGEPTEASAISESDVLLYMIPLEVSREWMGKYPTWLDFILKTTNKRYFDLVKMVHDLSFKSTGQRLIEWLDKNKDTEGFVFLKHELIAKELGTVREVVSRLLKSFEKQGRVVLKRGEVKVVLSE